MKARSLIKIVCFALAASLSGGSCVPMPVPGDSDNDGYPAPLDCNDDDSSIHPGAVEACNGVDDDCDGVVDNGVPEENKPCNTGAMGVCATGTLHCANAMLECKPEAFSSPEVCNGLDDDCDGVVDNGVPEEGMACDTGAMGVCAAGVLHCSGSKLECQQKTFSSPEACNDLDDDCDGVIDNGDPGGGADCTVSLELGECRKGTLHCVKDQKSGHSAAACVSNIAVKPANEVKEALCNGLDDDCDGSVDEGCDCTTGDTRPCGVGMGICQQVTITCDANGSWPICPAIQPQQEKCNGLDDNCDGVVDDGNPDGGALCTVPGKQGVCKNGTVQCINGGLTCVSLNPNGGPELCNDLDDDCDGQIDEDFPDKWQACDDGGIGECRGNGFRVCDGSGTGTVCLINVPGKLPSAEVCDGLDNDCNGLVDDVNGVANDACKTCVSFQNMRLVPDLMSGDADFDGHGPAVDITVSVNATPSQISVTECVDMREASCNLPGWPDFSDTKGHVCQTQSVVLKNNGLVNQSDEFYEATYCDNNWSTDDVAAKGTVLFNSSLVSSVQCIGDTDGSDVFLCGDPDCSACTINLGCLWVYAAP